MASVSINKFSKYQFFLFLAAVLLSCIPLTSAHAAGVWTDQTGSGAQSWYSIASSADGTHLAAAVCGGDIYTSADGGVTWTNQTASGSQCWISIASSADGTHLAAAVQGGDIYTSTNSGVTWTDQTAAGSREWASITSSADGSELAAADNGKGTTYTGDIYTSADGGATWTNQTAAGAQFWDSITSSADGTHLVAVDGDDIYASTDSGNSWTDVKSVSYDGEDWASITSSADGTHLAVVRTSGALYTSTNSGSSWTHQTSAPSEGWSAIISSADGTHLAAIVGTDEQGGIYLSSDGGVTWVESNAPTSFSWISIASSADGNRLAAVAPSGGEFDGTQDIYTYSSGAPTVTAQAASSTTQTTVTLNGDLTATGSTTVTSEGFNYGLTTSYGSTASSTGSFSIGTFTQNITGLTCDTTYHYESAASNSVGTSTSGDESFTTSACSASSPTVTTSGAASVATSTATLNGSITATGGANATQSGFTYSTFANLSSPIATSTLGSQTGTASFAQSLTGLAPNTTYYFRAYAINTGGTGYGSILSFTTSPLSGPTVTVQAASSITQTGVTFNGTVTSIGDAVVTIEGFNYGLTTSYGLTASSTGSFGVGAFTQSISGLTCNTTYHYEASASNSVGTSTSGDESFMTSACSASSPTLTTNAATSVATSTATINGAITATGGANATQSGFAYGTGPTLSSPLATSTLGSQTGTASFTQNLTGLSSSTTYYFRAYATNTGGTSYGGILSFTTGSLSKPTATVQAATSITTTGATLNGTITSIGDGPVTTEGFNYGLTTSYGLTASSTGSFGVGAFTQGVSGLTCNTTYHYEAVATNLGGTSTSSDQSFTTSACAPTVTTPGATSVSTSTATINGTITNTGGANATQSGFAYGTSAMLVTTIATSTLGSQTGAASFTQNLTGLTPNTTYYFRAYATNTGGTSYGSIGSFTESSLSGPTVTAQAASSTTQTTVTLNGDLTATGSTTVTSEGFNYGLTTSYGSTASSTGSFSIGTFTQNITGLTCDTTYHYESAASNSVGTSTSGDESFTTSACSGGDATPPVVSLATPPNGSTVVGTSVTLTATATDNVAVANVQFELDGTNLGSAITVSPYTTIWDSTQVANGSHTLSAVAEDTSGNYATSSITVTVDNTTPVSSGGGGGGGGGGGPISDLPSFTPNVEPSASTTVTVNSSLLTQTQQQAILSLLQSFGADQATITNVQSALEGNSVEAIPTISTTLPTSSCVFGANFGLGFSGEAITALQEQLTALGIYTGPVTGYFGTLTKTAVSAYQQENGIAPITGFVGPETDASLSGGSPQTCATPTKSTNSIVSVKYSPPARPEPQPTPKNPSEKVTPSETTPTIPTITPAISVSSSTSASGALSFGSTGEAVTALQQVLAQNGFYKGAITGKFDRPTQTAVEDFQKTNGITPTGSVGPRTQKALLQFFF